MKRVDFTITAADGTSLHEPVFVESCSELPVAIMQAVEDFLDAHDGTLNLPIIIRVQPSPSSPTC